MPSEGRDVSPTASNRGRSRKRNWLGQFGCWSCPFSCHGNSRWDRSCWRPTGWSFCHDRPMPYLLGWRKGRQNSPADILLFMYCLWCTISLVTVHGPSIALQPAGIVILETDGGYLVARCYIRDADDFRMPFACCFRSSRSCCHSPFSRQSPGATHSRAFLRGSSLAPAFVRSQCRTPLGVEASPGGVRASDTIRRVLRQHLALVHLVLGCEQKPIRRWLRTAIVGSHSVPLAFRRAESPGSPRRSCFSAGIGSGVRTLIVGKCFGPAVFLYVIVSLGSNQSVPEFFITHFSFDEGRPTIGS